MLKYLLQQISQNAIDLNPENYSKKEKKDIWIGQIPATTEAIADAQRRLGLILPEDIVELYKISNGTSEILRQTFGGFDAIESIDWLKKLQPETIEAYAGMGKEYMENLTNSIVISGANHPHMVLIIQPYGSSNKWRYWEFAHYIPGENVFEGIEKYLDRLNDFLKDQIKNKAEILPNIDYTILIEAVQKQDWMTVYSNATGTILRHLEYPKYEPDVCLYGLCLLATSHLGNQSHFKTVLESIPRFTKNKNVTSNPLLKAYKNAAKIKIAYLKDIQEFKKFKPKENPKAIVDIELQIKENRKDLLNQTAVKSKLDYQLYFLYEYGNASDFIKLYQESENYFDYLKSAKVFAFVGNKVKATELVHKYMIDVGYDERIFEVYLDEVLFDLIKL
jgi:hypothetical protein